MLPRRSTPGFIPATTWAGSSPVRMPRNARTDEAPEGDASGGRTSLGHQGLRFMSRISQMMVKTSQVNPPMNASACRRVINGL